MDSVSGSPSAMLLAAADLIRDLGASAFAGPWQAGEKCVWAVDDALDAVVDDGYEGSGGVINEETARWIAALSPALAGPIEAILRTAAHEVDVSSMVLNSVQFKAALADRFAPALGLARSILGSGVDTHG